MNFNQPYITLRGFVDEDVHVIYYILFEKLILIHCYGKKNHSLTEINGPSQFLVPWLRDSTREDTWWVSLRLSTRATVQPTQRTTQSWNTLG